MTEHRAFDEQYVRAILNQVGLRGSLTRAEFDKACLADLNAGWRAEVEEAWHRYEHIESKRPWPVRWGVKP